METEDTKKNEKNEAIFKCDCCDFKCSYLCDWNRHIIACKHQVSHKRTLVETEDTKKTRKTSH
jgi:hypothetical protein